MVEKRRSGGESAAVKDEDVDDTERERREALLEGLPDGVKPLPTVHDDMAEDLLKLAERQVAEMRGRFGPAAAKPRLEGIESLFVEQAGRAPRVDEDLQRLMRSAAAIQKVAVLDGTFDRTMAGAFNAYDKSSVQAGSNVQSAYDDWNMAVRIYKSELRAAGALLAAEINAARHPNHRDDDDDYDEPLRAERHVKFYARSAKIGQALLAHEKTMQQAGKGLADAYGQLNISLYNASDALAVAEATLIAANQTALSVFWTGVQSAVGQTRN